MEDTNFATELLSEVKASARRWFIAFIVVAVLWFASICAFIWYISLPVEEAVIQNDSGNANFIGRDLNGEVYNGEDYLQETGDEE